MSTTEAKDKAGKKSLLASLFSAEGAIFCIGIACMIYGVADGFRVMQFFFGVCIVGGSVALHFVRRKDWDAHWAEHERIRLAHEQRMAEEQEKKKQG
jgi:hypothetical protein